MNRTLQVFLSILVAVGAFLALAMMVGFLGLLTVMTLDQWRVFMDVLFHVSCLVSLVCFAFVAGGVSGRKSKDADREVEYQKGYRHGVGRVLVAFEMQNMYLSGTARTEAHRLLVHGEPRP